MNKDEYLKKVRRALWMIERHRREEIVKELNSEISERLRDGENIENIMKDMPEPNELKEEYKKIYGLSISAKFLIILAPAIISAFTLPIIPFTSTLFYGAPALLIILAIILFYISSNFGMKIGFAASAVSAILRFSLLYATSFSVALQNGTLLTESITSIIIFIIPIFGKKKK